MMMTMSYPEEVSPSPVAGPFKQGMSGQYVALPLVVFLFLSGAASVVPYSVGWCPKIMNP